MKFVVFPHSLNYISSGWYKMNQASDAGLAYFNRALFSRDRPCLNQVEEE